MVIFASLASLPIASGNHPVADPEAPTIVPAANDGAGETAQYNFVIRIPDNRLWSGDGVVRIQFPVMDDVGFGLPPAVTTQVEVNGQLATGTSPRDDPTNAIVTAVTTTELTIKRQMPATEALSWRSPVTLRIPGITNPLWSGTTDQFGYTLSLLDPPEDEGNKVAGVVITSNTIPRSAIFLDVTGSAVVKKTSSYVLEVSTQSKWPFTGAIEIGFPAGSSVATSGPTATLTPTANCDGDLSPVGPVVGGLVRFKRANTTKTCLPGPLHLAISGIENTGRAGPTGNFTVSTFGTATVAAPIDVGQGGSVFLLPDKGPFLAASITPVSRAAGAVGPHELSVTTSEAWPEGGALILSMLPPSPAPYPFNADSVSASIVSPELCGTMNNAAKTTTVEAARTVVKIPRLTGESCPLGEIVFSLENMKNPGVSGVQPSYAFALADADMDIHAQLTSLDVLIDPGATAIATVSPPIVGVGTSVTFPTTASNAWPLLGYVDVTVPAGFGLSTAQISACGSATVVENLGDGQIRGHRPSSATTDCPAGGRSIVLSGLTRIKAGPVGPFSISFYTSDGRLIESSAAATVTFHPTATATQGLELSPPLPETDLIQPASARMGETTSYVFKIGNLGTPTGTPSGTRSWSPTGRFAVG
ncbi:MAG TPA: hypothetical protein VGB18_03290, partial [Candidatus Thermoplasmatota archaeon]